MTQFTLNKSTLWKLAQQIQWGYHAIGSEAG